MEVSTLPGAAKNQEPKLHEFIEIYLYLFFSISKTKTEQYLIKHTPNIMHALTSQIRENLHPRDLK